MGHLFPLRRCFLKSRNSSQRRLPHPLAPGRPGPPPPRRLAALAGAVAAIHLLLLLGTSGPRILPPGRQAPTHTAVFTLPRADDRVPARVQTSAPPDPPPPRLADPGSQQGTPATAGPTAVAIGALGREPRAAPASAPALPEETRQTTRAADTPRAPNAGPDTPAPPSTALRLPAPLTLVYDLAGRSRGVSLAGQAELAWHHDGQQYEAQLSQAWASGQRELRSTGRLTAAGLAPTRFGDRSPGRGEQAAHFEDPDPPAPEGTAASPSTQGARVRFSGNQPDAELPAGAQDRLSVVLQLAARVAGLGRPPREGDRLDFPVATARSAALWRFRFEGIEWLPGPGTEREMLRWRRQPEGPHDLDMEVWLAPDLDYLPVRWRLTLDNGDWLEQRWTGDYRP